MEIKRHIQTSVENKARQTFCCYSLHLDLTLSGCWL